MGYAVVHMQKIKAGGVRGIQSHNNREHPPKTNPDIDPGKTPDNYDLLSERNYIRKIKAAIKNQATETKTVRKDAVVMCSFIVTSDNATMSAMRIDQQRDFFEKSLEWFSNRYGVDNIVNATVHMDETTPHLHLGVVPVKDKRLSAKNLFTKQELRSVQTDFAVQVGANFGLERGKEGSENKHLTEQQFKLKTAKSELENLEIKKQQAYEGAVNLSMRGEKIASDADRTQKRVDILQKEKNRLEAKIGSLKSEYNILFAEDTRKELESELHPFLENFDFKIDLTKKVPFSKQVLIDPEKAEVINSLLTGVRDMALDCQRILHAEKTLRNRLSQAEKTFIHEKKLDYAEKYLDILGVGWDEVIKAVNQEMRISFEEIQLQSNAREKDLRLKPQKQKNFDLEL